MMRSLFFILCIFFSTKVLSQDLNSHLWKDRVILIASKKNSTIANKQWKELLKDQKQLKERKLIVYLIQEDYIKSSKDNLSVKTHLPYKKFKPKKGDFEITLIGLDGGVKLQRQDFISASTIFTIIDGMPMRRNELRNKN